MGIVSHVLETSSLFQGFPTNGYQPPFAMSVSRVVPSGRSTRREELAEAHSKIDEMHSRVAKCEASREDFTDKREGCPGP